MIDVIDYSGGNLGSVLRALERLEIPHQCCNNASLPKGKNPILLPGVGAFGAVMEKLNTGGFSDRLKVLLQEKVPYLGICVGLQILFESSEENPVIAGLGVLKGKNKRFTGDKVPQIGWNEIQAKHNGFENGYVYFVNSYYAQPENSNSVLYESQYDTEVFCAAVRAENITAFQFHPEKSGDFGHQLLKDWADATV